MNLRQLEVFRAVCEQGGFTRAAQSLYMTQPAVSHVIAELEKEAGCPLFDRISRRIYLTEAGRIFLEKARQILELHEELSAGFPALTGQAPYASAPASLSPTFISPPFCAAAAAWMAFPLSG